MLLVEMVEELGVAGVELTLEFDELVYGVVDILVQSLHRIHPTLPPRIHLIFHKAVSVLYLNTVVERWVLSMLFVTIPAIGWAGELAKTEKKRGVDVAY